MGNKLADILQSFGQGASNAVAANVTAPVDGIAWLLRKAGLDIQNPVGGSDWATQQGLLAEPKNRFAGLLGEGIGGAAPFAVLSKAPQMARGLLQISENQGVKDMQSLRINGKIADPNPLPQRSFYDDYPGATGGNAGSQLAHDIDGNALGAKFIAGRRVGGGLDEALTPGQIEQVASALGATTRRTGSKELGTDLGQFRNKVGPDGTRMSELLLNQNLPARQVPHVFAHEAGHLIDGLTYGGGIPQAGVKREMQQVFSDLNSANYVPKGKIGATPQSFGYSGSSIPAELNAENIRAYMRDPNYFKSVAPNAAKRIREYVNQNQNLKDVIQFNSLAGIAGLTGQAQDTPGL